VHIFEPLRGHRFQVTPAGRCRSTSRAWASATGIAFDGEENLYVGDRQGTILQNQPSRQIYVFATVEPSIAAYHHLGHRTDQAPVRHRGHHFEFRFGLPVAPRATSRFYIAAGAARDWAPMPRGRLYWRHLWAGGEGWCAWPGPRSPSSSFRTQHRRLAFNAVAFYHRRYQRRALNRG